MDQDRSMRGVLWVSAAFNFGAAFLFAFPASQPGQLVGLPAAVPLIYSALVALFVVLFGGSYAWLAMQPVIFRPFVAFAAIGKSSVFLLAMSLWMAGEIPGRLALISAGDLAFAALYALWLLK